jgi:tRNA(fMet)-specific endonuclease VapC
MLDTDISSDIIKGRSPKVEAELSALEPSMVCVSAMTRAELLYPFPPNIAYTWV